MKTDTIETTRITDDDIRIEKNEHGQEVYIFDPFNPLNLLPIQNYIKEHLFIVLI